jgi:muconate cycloisomerase
VTRLELRCVDLPFRRPFRHAAAERACSGSLFLKCETDAGATGFGESLPREYVTGETRDGAFDLLRQSILPKLAGMEFHSMAGVRRFLFECDGKAPSPWVPERVPQTAAWCAVDLALWDAFGRAWGEPVRLDNSSGKQASCRYGGVVSAGQGWRFLLSLLKIRAYGLGDVKLKTGTTDVTRCARLARRILSKRATVRVDANMAWDVPEALGRIRDLKRIGVRCVEQPVAADDLEGLATLARDGGLEIIADESLTDGVSWRRLQARRASSGINVRISKCGGLAASARRCEEAARAGWTLQIGCQVGESSLLSAAQLILVSAAPTVQFLEGCYGRHLLKEDPARPSLQFGYGGRPPQMPEGAGLGVEVDESALDRWTTRRAVVEASPAKRKEKHHVLSR